LDERCPASHYPATYYQVPLALASGSFDTLVAISWKGRNQQLIGDRSSSGSTTIKRGHG
jgi:hypothetical protein